MHFRSATTEFLGWNLLTKFSFEEWLQSIITASPEAALAVGIGLTIGGSCLMAVGSVVMKNGIHQESKRLQRDIHMPLSSQLWWLGLTTYSIGAFLHIVGLGFAPASVLAPLNSLGLVANAAAAVVFLQETLSWVEITCTLGAVFGVTFCAVSSFLPHDESCVVDGINSWTDPLYLIYVSVCGAALIVFLILVNNAEAHVADEQWEATFRRHLEGGHIELTDFGGGVSTGFTTVQQHIDSYNPNRTSLPKLGGPNFASTTVNGQNETEAPLQSLLYPGHIGVFYSVVAGIVGAQCVLQLKEFSAFLKLAVDDVRVWASVQPYLAGSFGIISIILQMHFLNLALARGDATLVIPTYYVFWTIFGTIGGFVKFHEIFGFTGIQICLFFFGLILTLVSIALMASLDIERVQSEVERTSPSWPGLPERITEAPLRFGVPLAVGLGIIPVGRLAGRFRAVPAAPKLLLRRTQSFADFPHTRTDSLTGGGITVGARAQHDPSLWLEGRHPSTAIVPPYSWTVAGGLSPNINTNHLDGSSSVHRQSRLGHYEPINGHRGIYHSREDREERPLEQSSDGTTYWPRSSFERNGCPMPIECQPQNSNYWPSGAGKKYKRVKDILFEEEPQHQSVFCEDHVAYSTNMVSDTSSYISKDDKSTELLQNSLKPSLSNSSLFLQDYTWFLLLKKSYYTLLPRCLNG